jgi:hypothetical protein
MIFTPMHGRDAGEQPKLGSRGCSDPAAKALQTNYRERS